MDVLTLQQAAIYIGGILIVVILCLLFIIFITFIVNVFNFFNDVPDILKEIRYEINRSNKLQSEILHIYRNKGEPCFDELLRKMDEETCQKEAKKKPLIIT